MPKRKSDAVVDISSDEEEPSTSNKKARKSNQSDVSASTSTAPKLTKAQKVKEDEKKEQLEELEAPLEEDEVSISRISVRNASELSSDDIAFHHDRKSRFCECHGPLSRR